MAENSFSLYKIFAILCVIHALSFVNAFQNYFDDDGGVKITVIGDLEKNLSSAHLDVTSGNLGQAKVLNKKKIPKSRILKNLIRNNAKPEVPRILFENATGRLWFAEDVTFRQPVAFMTMLFRFPAIYHIGRKDAMVSLYARMVNAIGEKMNAAIKSNCSVDVFAHSSQSFAIEISGDVRKVDQLTGYLMDIMLSLNVSKIDKSLDLKGLFQKEKDSWLDNLKSVAYAKEPSGPYFTSLKYYSMFTKPNQAAEEELAEELKYIDVTDMEMFRQNLFSKFHLETFAYGNLVESDAKAIFFNVMAKIYGAKSGKVRPLRRVEMDERRIVKFEPRANYHFETVSPIHQNQSANLVVFQIEVPSYRDVVMLELLGKAISALFSTKFIEEKLGYRVFAYPAIPSTCGWFFFTLNGPYHPKYIEFRINGFVGQIKDELEKMNFEILKSEFKKDLLEKKPSTQKGQWFAYWFEISQETFDFEKDSRSPLEVDSISKQDLIDFVGNIFNTRSINHKRLSVQVYGKEQILANDIKIDNEYTRNMTTMPSINLQVESKVEFKRQLPLCELRKPFGGVKLAGI